MGAKCFAAVHARCESELNELTTAGTKQARMLQARLAEVQSACVSRHASLEKHTQMLDGQLRDTGKQLRTCAETCLLRADQAAAQARSQAAEAAEAQKLLLAALEPGRQDQQLVSLQATVERQGVVCAQQHAQLSASLARLQRTQAAKRGAHVAASGPSAGNEKELLQLLMRQSLQDAERPGPAPHVQQSAGPFGSTADTGRLPLPPGCRVKGFADTARDEQFDKPAMRQDIAHSVPGPARLERVREGLKVQVPRAFGLRVNRLVSPAPAPSAEVVAQVFAEATKATGLSLSPTGPRPDTTDGLYSCALLDPAPPARMILDDASKQSQVRTPSPWRASSAHSDRDHIALALREPKQASKSKLKQASTSRSRLRSKPAADPPSNANPEAEGKDKQNNQQQWAVQQASRILGPPTASAAQTASGQSEGS